MSDPGELIIGVICIQKKWYWWSSSPDAFDDAGGHVPDGDNIGPFESSKDAWQDALSVATCHSN